MEELNYQGVTDVVNISVKADDGSITRRSTNSFILTFALSNPPQFIHACYLRISISKYIPNPLRCFKCQKFGHGRSNCRSSLVCAKCGQSGHDLSECSAEVKCASRSGNHMASSKGPIWLREKQVQKIKAEKGCSFVEARKLVTQQTQPARTAAAVVQSRPDTSGMQKKASRAVQTDLT